MFLNQLKEENKELFLKVCIHAALSDEVFTIDEKEMIFAYCKEMNIPENVPDCNESLEDVLKDLAAKTSDTEKNIILLEILGLVKSDGVYDEKEKNFMDSFAKSLQVKDGLLSKIHSLLAIYTTVCKEIYATIYE